MAYTTGINAHKCAAEGDFRSSRDTTPAGTIHNNILSDPVRGPRSPFYRVVVLEVLNDVTLLDESKISYYKQRYSIQNTQQLSDAPRDSIIGKPVNVADDINEFEACSLIYPFFPPHLSLPLKAGEHVWVFDEGPQQSFWMSRIVEPRIADDINHTHPDRKFLHQDQTATDKSIDTPSDIDEFEFYNGPSGSELSNASIQPGSVDWIRDDVAGVYKRLLKDTDSAKASIKEAVPRITKRPGDFVIHGSNNAAIILGTDRSGVAFDTTQKVDNSTKETIKVVSKIPDSDEKENAGTIDIVVGRGRSTKKKNSGTVKKNAIQKSEISKFKKDELQTEGDIEFESDKSRIYVTMKSKIDKNFALDSLSKARLSEPQSSVEESSAGIVVKSDKVRIVARNDLKIVVKRSKTNANGDLVETTNDNECAAIIIKASGDIVFLPASDGVVKIGGDDANLGILCTPIAANAAGQVTGTPIVDNMGGMMGSGGNNGVFAKKVLLK